MKTKITKFRIQRRKMTARATRLLTPRRRCRPPTAKERRRRHPVATVCLRHRCRPPGYLSDWRLAIETWQQQHWEAATWVHQHECVLCKTTVYCCPVFVKNLREMWYPVEICLGGVWDPFASLSLWRFMSKSFEFLPIRSNCLHL
jgi:hypothetical protein